ncbi:zinc/manganese transport system substrate-binding protein [Streptomyces olivoverticillatus]|uniref:Zinc/manganese transport system substrate-binding protein n=1 Tax=Streptomyces olivoverticillatus TaxID=66427 RepID=A0A7W7LK47_9ACTN|nr:zinc ABC transporter substrate-binding protein [Streptomyces olivoverticillatus]MBB4891131.1 zinc/manganese transport system substrate-binding protein [Streptomyces olivoverticillatus]
MSTPSAAPTPRRARPAVRISSAAAMAVLTAVSAAACSTSSPASSSSKTGGSTPDGASGRTIRVVAAENFWGSIAAQLGGGHVHVASIIANPDTDPHDYEPTAADARTVAGARYAIVNGVGYDAWADKLLAANPAAGRAELKVGDLAGVKPGGNPHRWYAPDDVHQVIEKITEDYKKADPADAAYFDQRKKDFETKDLATYNKLIADIKSTYHGTPIGASESIVSPLADGLGLKMLTPRTFLDAMSEGADPTAKDKAAIDDQIKNKQIKVYVYNTQNSTPDVQAQVKEAKDAGIPVAAVTETLTPADATFQQWQTAQLQGIEQALAKATGR